MERVVRCHSNTVSVVHMSCVRPGQIILASIVMPGPPVQVLDVFNIWNQYSFLMETTIANCIILQFKCNRILHSRAAHLLYFAFWLLFQTQACLIQILRPNHLNVRSNNKKYYSDFLTFNLQEHKKRWFVLYWLHSGHVMNTNPNTARCCAVLMDYFYPDR